MTKKLLLILWLASPLALSSCGDSVLGPSDLQGEWRLRSLTRSDGSTVTIADPSLFTLRFEADGDLAARVDCNTCGGTYSLDGDSVTSGPLACTRVFCGPLSADTVFLAILEGRSSLELDDSRLTVSSGRGSLVFER